MATMTPPTEILTRYGEIFLKGKNQFLFEQVLIHNIRSMTGIKHIQRGRGRILLPFFEGHKGLQRIFGLTSYSLAYKTEPSLEKIQEKAFHLLRHHEGSFKINTRRSNKQFPVTSAEVNVSV